MSLAALQETAVQTDASSIDEGRMDAHMIRALDRMRDWCARNPMGQAILAKGLIVDSTQDLVSQIIAFFPGIDVSPIVDDVALFIAENAQSSGQKIQEVKFHYVADGKRPKIEDANRKTALKVYADKIQRATGATTMTKVLKADGGGSSGDANQMTAELTAGLVKYFMLEVGALDITDAKAADLAVVQALGGNPAALSEALDTLAKGGADAKALQAVIEQIVEIKTLRTALTQAGDTPAAASIAAALALKTETLSASLATLKTPNAVRAEITRSIETIKADLTGRQMEGVVANLSRAFPSIMARTANDSGSRTGLNIQIARAVEALNITARTHGMPVRDIIALSISKTATPDMTSAVRGLTTLLARPDFLPGIERKFPARISAPIRDALTTPVLQAVVQTPVSLQPVAQALKAMGDASGNPTIKMAAITMDGLSQPSVASPILRAPTVQSVAENLQAVSLMENKTPPAGLKMAMAQIEAINVQMREPAPQPAHTPQPLEPQAPLAALAKAMDVKAPEIIPPVAQPPVDLKQEFTRGTGTPRIEQPKATSEHGYKMPGVDAGVESQLRDMPGVKDVEGRKTETMKMTDSAQKADAYKPAEIEKKDKKDLNDCQPPNCPCAKPSCKTITKEVVQEMAATQSYAERRAQRQTAPTRERALANQPD